MAGSAPPLLFPLKPLHRYIQPERTATVDTMIETIITVSLTYFVLRYISERRRRTQRSPEDDIGDSVASCLFFLLLTGAILIVLMQMKW